ncbi:1-acyl-sn-glycerol-3-phosphate acyltransferase [Halovulum dunhuangense]|uniref:1-acyl-sn-glycerol-3-phosphate acyltransferase n=1 Tax=Halovulum dunhuangense TaxID=1505036 RepID=A0A849L097_9RHOB|nr:1-acyl-sn-glycerol-3-phosphate acyltransferase [Halovulum dunhuangense]NNU79650.1 1-acyl-sn-glycerol-3-phosphate acyltransferase [Halovulum dunhuangense]
MQLLRSLVFDLCFYSLMLVMGILYAPLAMLRRDGANIAIRHFCIVTLWLLERICGLRCEVRGTVPQGDVIIASKHQSFLDILIHCRHLPRPRFIMKKELKWAPILGLYAMRMGSTPVHRGRKGETVQKMLASEARTNGNGQPGQLVIYPQGTRVHPSARVPYKVGAGVLYQRFRKPCIPAATNVGIFWGRNSMLRKPGLAVVEYLPEIPAGLSLQDFMGRMEREVETASDALMAEAGFTREAD